MVSRNICLDLSPLPLPLSLPLSLQYELTPDISGFIRSDEWFLPKVSIFFSDKKIDFPFHSWSDTFRNKDDYFSTEAQ
jgi:hypothetical protein